MSSHSHQTRRLSAPDMIARKGGEKIVCLTAYTAPMARLLDAHVDVLLVGDSLGMVLYGFESTLPVTLEMMIAHGKAVAAHSQKAFVLMDMPFGSYQQSPEQAFMNAARLIQETGAGGVKLEGGLEMVPTAEFMVQRGIPVCAHIGLCPQQVHRMGGYRYQGRDDEAKALLHAQAKAFEEAGAFALLLEGMDEALARDITSKVAIPTIGIGASPACDGQVLVLEDMLGLNPNPPRFVKEYGQMQHWVNDAVQRYAQEVRQGSFPEIKHCFGVKAN